MHTNFVKALSSLGGLTIVSVVLGVTISKDASLRAEISRQLNSFLGTTRALLGIYQSLFVRKKQASETGSAKYAVVANAGQAGQPVLENMVQDAANQQWDKVQSELT
ncbi:MAG: hypothetical protein LBC35_03395 [Coriobacteriales bacterium]|jgi:hypothetical protein|nr:hypothetical protein [Coriobacteriales bacterium]